MDSQEEQIQHVHFEEAEDNVKTNQIVIQKKKNCLEIQLGFLQVHHMYEIQADIPQIFLPSNLRLMN